MNVKILCDFNYSVDGINSISFERGDSTDKFDGPTVKKLLDRKWVGVKNSKLHPEGKQPLGELSKKLAKASIEITSEAVDGKLSKSITHKQIVAKLNGDGYAVERHQVHLEDPITELGKYSIKVQIAPDPAVTIKLVVVANKGSEKVDNENPNNEISDEERLETRKEEILKAGAELVDGEYICLNVKIPEDELMDAPDEQWDEFIIGFLDAVEAGKNENSDDEKPNENPGSEATDNSFDDNDNLPDESEKNDKPELTKKEKKAAKELAEKNKKK